MLETRRGIGVFVREFSLDALIDNLPYGLGRSLRDIEEIIEIRKHAGDGHDRAGDRAHAAGRPGGTARHHQRDAPARRARRKLRRRGPALPRRAVPLPRQPHADPADRGVLARLRPRRRLLQHRQSRSRCRPGATTTRSWRPWRARTWTRRASASPCTTAASATSSQRQGPPRPSNDEKGRNTMACTAFRTSHISPWSLGTALACLALAPAFAQKSVISGGFDVGPGGFPGNFNPMAASAGFTWLSTYFEPLVVYDAKLEKLAPALATSWQVSPDKLTYTFKLAARRQVARRQAVHLRRREVHHRPRQGRQGRLGLRRPPRCREGGRDARRADRRHQAVAGQCRPHGHAHQADDAAGAPALGHSGRRARQARVVVQDARSAPARSSS